MVRGFLLRILQYVLLTTGCLAVAAGGLRAEAIIADHYVVAAFDGIPLAVVDSIGDDYNIFYVHTSHGSQIMTGIDMVYDENSAFDPPYFYQYGDDLGHVGDTSWAPPTRTYLNAHPECNMAMFSWCGGCSDNTEAGINIYLAKMEELEADYPGVIFIYMTGHLDGSGPEENLYARNNQIRDYCVGHDKILFDFADIESYDPDGTWYPDETDICYWCSDWCAVHTCPTCGSCAHSHCFNCYLKGKAWWWMMAEVSGWEPTPDTCCGVYCGGITGNTNCDDQCKLNLSDITALVTRVYISPGLPLCCEANGDVTCDGKMNLSDITQLTSRVYIDTEVVLCECAEP